MAIEAMFFPPFPISQANLAGPYNFFSEQEKTERKIKNQKTTAIHRLEQQCFPIHRKKTCYTACLSKIISPDRI